MRDSNVYVVVRRRADKTSGVIDVFEFNSVKEKEVAYEKAISSKGFWANEFNDRVDIVETYIARGRCNEVINVPGRFPFDQNTQRDITEEAA